jgi:hypothetical protein
LNGGARRWTLLKIWHSWRGCIDQHASDADARRAILYAALGFCQLAEAPAAPEVTGLKAWLSTWSGIGHIVVGWSGKGSR